MRQGGWQTWRIGVIISQGGETFDEQPHAGELSEAVVELVEGFVTHQPSTRFVEDSFCQQRFELVVVVPLNAVDRHVQRRTPVKQHEQPGHLALLGFAD